MNNSQQSTSKSSSKSSQKIGLTRFTYKLLIYLDRFITISMREQGNYWIEVDVIAYSAKVIIADCKYEQKTTKKFYIKYTSQEQSLQHLIQYTIHINDNIEDFSKGSSSKDQNIYLKISVMRETAEDQYDFQAEGFAAKIVNQYYYKIKTHNQNTFIEYIQAKLQLNYAANISGIVGYFLTNIQIYKYNDNNILLLQKLAKQQRYSSYITQKQFQQSCNNSYQYKIRLPLLDNLIQMSIIETQIKQFSKFPDAIDLADKEVTQADFFQYLSGYETTKKTVEEIRVELGHNSLQNFLLCSLCAEFLRKKQLMIKVYKQQFIRVKLEMYNARIFKIDDTDQIKCKDEPEHQELLSINQSYVNEKIENLMPGISEFRRCQTVLKIKKQQINLISVSNKFRVVPLNPKHNFRECPFIVYSSISMKNCSQKKNESILNKENYTTLCIFAHGYKASVVNMKKLQVGFKRCFSRGKYLSLESYSEEMDEDIDQMGKKAAKQIQIYVKKKKNTLKQLKIVMIGHSMGGLILRASLQYLSKEIIDSLHTYISIATPHLGYLYIKSVITGAGLKILDSCHSSQSIRQLSHNDCKDFRQTFIYKLSKTGSLKNFKHILLFSSLEDKYVVWNSARIQQNKIVESPGKHKKRDLEQQMINNIWGIKQQQPEAVSKIQYIHRFNVDFNIKETYSINQLIGRTSHVMFLTDDNIVQMAMDACIDASLKEQLSVQ